MRCHYQTTDTVLITAYLPASQKTLRLVLTSQQATRVLDVVFEGHQQLRYVLNKRKLAIVTQKVCGSTSCVVVTPVVHCHSRRLCDVAQLVIRQRVGEGIRLAVQYPSQRGFRTQVKSIRLNDRQYYLVSAWERRATCKFELHQIRARGVYHFEPQFFDYLLVLQDMPLAWRRRWEPELRRHNLLFDADSMVALETPRIMRKRLSAVERELQASAEAARARQPPNPREMAQKACVRRLAQAVVCGCVCVCGCVAV